MVWMIVAAAAVLVVVALVVPPAVRAAYRMYAKADDAAFKRELRERYGED